MTLLDLQILVKSVKGMSSYETERITQKEFASRQILCHLKGCARYIFASLFLGLNESTCQIKKNVFYFTSKPHFVLEKIKF